MPSLSSFLLIGALAAQANTTKDTVRYYYEMGLLKSRQCQAGSRLYTEFHPGNPYLTHLHWKAR